MIRLSQVRSRGARSLSTAAATLILAAGLLLAAPSVRAASVLGTWDIELDYQGNLIPSTLTVTEEGGKLKGVWSGARGDAEIENLKFEDGVLTFVREVNFQDQAFELEYEGTVDGDKLTGVFVTPMGEIEANGKRSSGGSAGGAAPAAGLPGTWELVVDSQLGKNTRTMVIGDDMIGTYKSEIGEFKTDKMKFDGKNLSFSLELAMDGNELTLDFTGTVTGTTLEGSFASEFGDAAVTGKKLGGGAAPAAGGLAGKWNMEIETPDGAATSGEITFTDKGDGSFSAVLSTDLGDIEIPSVTLSGNDISFATDADFGGMEIPVSFAGKMNGAEITGTVSLEFEGQAMDLPTRGTKAGGAAAGGADIAGEWTMNIETPDGAETTGVLTFAPNGDGTFKGVLSTDLGDIEIPSVSVAGNKVTFATDADFGGMEIPVSFDGTVDGDKVTGIVKLTFEGEAMELPVEGSRTGKAAASGGADISGVWEMDIETPDGATTTGEMTFTGSGSTYKGVLSTDLGDIEIPVVSVAGNKVTFATDADFGGMEIPVSFDGTVDGDKVTGTVSLEFEGEAMDLPVEGRRKSGGAAGPAVAGKWALDVELPDGSATTASITISGAASPYSGAISTELGDATIGAITVEGNEVSFTTKIDYGGAGVPISFKGTVDGDTLAGNVQLELEGEAMDLPVAGKLIEPAVASGVAGKWDLEAELPDGSYSEASITIGGSSNPYSGKISTQLGDATIDAITLAGSDISFTTKFDYGGAGVPVSFSGKLKGTEMTGIVKLSLEGEEMEIPVTGKLTEPAGAGPVRLAGKWDLEVETSEGMTSQSEVVVYKKGDKFTGHVKTELGEGDIDEIKLAGNELSFAVKVEFQGAVVPMEFKGTITGDTLDGLVIIDFEGDELEMPIKGKRTGDAAEAPAGGAAKTTASACCTKPHCGAGCKGSPGCGACCTA